MRCSSVTNTFTSNCAADPTQRTLAHYISGYNTPSDFRRRMKNLVQNTRRCLSVHLQNISATYLECIFLWVNNTLLCVVSRCLIEATAFALEMPCAV